MISTDINEAVQCLVRGDFVSIPTETVYGLAGNIYDENAIKKIFELKKRPLFNPLIVHTHSITELDKFVDYTPSKAQILAKKFWPGSLTLVLKKKNNVPDLITAGKDTVAIRVPKHPVALKLLEGLEFPLAAPSANPFGSISPTRAEHVHNYFGDQLSIVLDGGSCENGLESTIIGFNGDEPVLYRLGSISIEEIEAEVGSIEIANKKEKAPDAPGMLSRHYAPSTRTYLVDNVSEYIKTKAGRIGIILFESSEAHQNIQTQITLSETGNLKEAASKLYESLHQLDKLNLDCIVAEKFPDYGLGKSINDRLERATKQKD